MDHKPTDDPKRNPDPITGEPGSHPVGTGVGTAGGGLAGAAIGGTVGGPVGAAIGAIVGGVAGAVGGHGVAEAVNPTAQETYWREHHASQPYANQEYSYLHYSPAYRTGYEAVTKYAGKTFEEIESDVALDYERNRADSALPWDQARHATHAAWSKISGTVAPRDPTRGTRSGI